jgi:hypothetical protein
MGNAGHELHALYAEWRDRMPDGNTSALMSVDVREDRGVEEVMRAYALLTEIDRTLARLQANGANVGVFQRQLHGWARIPLMIEVGWTTATSKAKIFPRAVLEQIETFALYLDGKVHVFSTSELTSLGHLVDQAREALVADDTLPAELVQYIHQLLQEIRVALNNEEIGRTFDFAEATRRLWVSLRAASGASEGDEQKSRWRKLADAIAVGTVSSAVIESGTALIRLMLES